VRLNVGKMESADHGTLFLDEIGDVPLAMQVKLLRFLQDQIVERVGGRKPIQVDVRIICATNQDLDRMMAEGRFREDLYYRLNEVAIRVPPLRERLGDAVFLASFFLRRFAAEYDRPVRGFGPGTLAAIAFAKRSWPVDTRRGAAVALHSCGAGPRRARGPATGACPGWRQPVESRETVGDQPADTLRLDAAAPNRRRYVRATCLR